MSEKVSDNELQRTQTRCMTAAVISVIGMMALSAFLTSKSSERIKLAKIAAATSQYCDCLKLIEVE